MYKKFFFQEIKGFNVHYIYYVVPEKRSEVSKLLIFI